MSRLIILLLVAFFALSTSVNAADNASRPVTVFAAASLTDALQEIGAMYAQQGAPAVRFSFAASSVLAKQIEAGNSADLFFSADSDWMDYLQSRNMIKPQSRHDVLGNGLVLIAPADSKITLKIVPGFSLMAALGSGRLAMADPDSVPAGRYARSALTALGVWDHVADHIVRADNVRTAMYFVARGEAPLGIVYTTDAQIDTKVRIVDIFPETSHTPITYPLALTSVASPQAQSFLTYLRGAAAAAVFKKYGFVVLP